MFSNPLQRVLFTVSILLISMALSCNYKFIRLRIYPPLPSKTYVSDQKLKGFEIVDERKLDNRLGLHQPYFFNERILFNEYGSLANILAREIQNHPEKYSKVLNKDNSKIHIIDFQVGTKDSCWKNISYVKFHAELQIASRIESFIYKDSIDSKVTDCFLIGSSLTLIPLLIYIPYQGFRGNREDQVNELGRNAIDAFLHYLQEKDYKPLFKKYNSQVQVEARTESVPGIESNEKKKDMGAREK